MKVRFLLPFLLAAPLMAQNWSTFLDPSRAIDWSGAGFTIPNYTVNCAIQPSLGTGTGNAASNTASVQASIASCDATHNVVNIPAGTWYFTSIDYAHKSNVVVRGAGASSTTILTTANTANNFIPSSISLGCNDDNTVFCRIWSNTELQPPSGAYQCAWTAGYTKGATSITLNTCGSTPPVNSLIVLDQANDTSDNGGVSVCDAFSSGAGYPCAQETPNNNANGRNISGIIHSQTQVVRVTAVSGSGAGPYTVTIAQPVAFNNIRTGAGPGAFWSPNVMQNDGFENMAVDFTGAPDGLALTNCYQCWVKGAAFRIGNRSDVSTHQTLQAVIRDSYFYSSQNPSASQSYGVETSVATSGSLIENNIFQQLTIPIQFGSGTGNVIGYNYVTDNQFGATNMAPASSLHSAGADMNLWEGNVANQIIADDSWGASNNGTIFRNSLTGWQLGKNQFTYAIGIYATNRAFNAIGNVLGQPSYDTLYESYATSTTAGVNGGDPANLSVYNLGWTGYSGWGGCVRNGTTGSLCDTKSRSTLMRWGNYDTVNAGVRWDATEASPGAVTYVAANFSSGYFGTLAHTLPASLYYSSTPSWWPSGKNWPPIGPDVTTGNVGICTGTYAGSTATASGQCTGGTLSTAWSSLVTSIPAQDCFLTTMGGKPDGSGSVLAFNPATCYASTPTFTWTLTTGANGTVTGTNCNSGTKASGATIGACTAVPNTGYSFGTWTAVTGSAGCSGSTNPCPSFAIAANSTATANFTINSYTLSTATAGTGSGTVTTCAGSRVYNTAYTCTVTPAAGSSITSVTGCSGSGTTSYTGLMPASNCTVTATFAGTVATPIFSPVAGPYGAAQTVTLATSTSGASIYYTTDGTTPTTGSTLYTVPFSVSTTQTVKALGVKASWTNSAVASALYTINGTLATPTFLPVAGSYGSTQFVTIGIPQTTIVNQMTETSNATDSAGHAVHRNVYGNCAQSCSGGVPQPPNAGAVSHGSLWCNASQSVACGAFSLSNITSTLTNSGVSLLENGLGQGGVDSAPTETATYAGVTGTGCGVGATFASNLIGGLTLPGETATSRAVFGLTTASSGFNTSMLAVSKYDTNGDGGNNLERVDCASPNVITVAGQHYEWDSNYNTAGGSYMGFGMDYNFVTSKFRAAFQDAPAWIDMELCPVAGGSCITTYSWPAGDYLFSERHDYWDSGCTFSSGTQCAHYGQICLQLWASGSAVNTLTCYNIQNAATHAAISAIPINKTTWTRPQYGVQHQWDVNGASATLTANVAFDHLVAYANVSATICFTNDGSTPTGDGNGNCTHGNVFTGPITVSSSQTLKAIATAPGYTDSTAGTAAYVIGGTASWTQTVVGSGAITGTNSASNNYLLLTTIGPLTAAAATGYTFTGWSSVTGDAGCTGSTTPCPSFSLSTASAATATFTVNSYTLTASTAGTGTGTNGGCNGAHNFGATYTCTATATGGSTFTGWSSTCSGTPSGVTYSGPMPASNCSVIASFAAAAPTNQILLSNVRLSGSGVKLGQ